MPLHPAQPSPFPSSSSSTSTRAHAPAPAPAAPEATHISIPPPEPEKSSSPSTPKPTNITSLFAPRPLSTNHVSAVFDSSSSSSSASSAQDTEDRLAQLSLDSDSSRSPFDTMGNVTESQASMQQVMAGLASISKELSRLHMRMDALESQNERMAQRKNSFYANGSPPGSLTPSPMVMGIPRMERAPSPDKVSDYFGGASYMAPHLAISSLGAVAQPAPILTAEPTLGLWAVVPAGGAGTRLWPLSRESYPKFLLDLTGSGRTLLQSTWDRLLPLAGPSRMMIVTGAAHVGGVADQLPELHSSNLLAEPSPKESMAAIGLAAAVLQKRDPEAVLGSFAADHIISGRDAFESAVTEAVATAKAGYLVTIGIAPSHPSTGFGYIKLGEGLDVEKAPNARIVADFKEKPDARTAASYLSTGEYRWNGGMFVVKAKVLLDLLKHSVPELYAGLDRIASAWDTSSRDAVVAEVWPTLPKIAIDHAVAEPAAKVGKVAVIPATFGWDDVGDFASLAELIPAEKNEARVLGDHRLVVTESQAGGLVVPASGRPIACLGVDDVVVVDTPDALLITTRARSQDVKKIVARCKKVYPSLC